MQEELHLFAGGASLNTAKDIKKAVNHNKTEDYEKLRQDLKNIGSDCLDLLLTVPLVPKSVQQFKRQAKVIPNGLKFNSELWQNFKNAKGILPKYRELAKADLKMLYEMHKNDMRLKFAPKLNFVDEYKVLSQNLEGGLNFHNGDIYKN